MISMNDCISDRVYRYAEISAGAAHKTAAAHKPASALILAAVFLLAAAHPMSADQPVFSGVAESNVDAAHDTDGSWRWAIEQFANLRMRAEAGENAVIHAALNTSASSADERELTVSAELERLYFSIRGENADIDAGYMRIAFGYGQAFRPSDLVNPPNPLYPEARPKGALGALYAIYPDDNIRLQLFGADRSSPYEAYPGFSRPLAGISGDLHTTVFSAQLLYAMQAPDAQGSQIPVNYCGFSLKFDAGAGFALDTLYTFESTDVLALKGLQFAFGADYSLFDGDFYALFQYFFNGDGVLESDDELSDLYGTDDWADLDMVSRYPAGGYSEFYRRHYLFTSLIYSVDDYTRINGSLLSSLSDQSFLPAVTLEHEPFQGMTLSLTARVPLDLHTLGGGRRGELGPDNFGYTASIRGSVKMRF